MKKCVTALLAASLLACGLGTAYADIKVGTLDLPVVLQKSPQISSINQKLKEQFAPQQQQIVALQNKLRAEVQKLNNPDTNKTLSSDERKKLQTNIASDQKELQQAVMKYQESAGQAQSGAMKQFMSEVSGAAKTVAAKQGLDMVLLKPAVIYANNVVDVTQDVIDQMPKK